MLHGMLIPWAPTDDKQVEGMSVQVLVIMIVTLPHVLVEFMKNIF